MQNLNRHAETGFSRRRAVRNIKMMRMVVRCEPVPTDAGSTPGGGNSCPAPPRVAENVSRSWTA